MSNQNQQWLDALEIAIIELDEKKIDSLIDDMPSFENLEQMQIALALMAQAQKSLKAECLSIQNDMAKVRKSRAFLEPYMKEKDRLLDQSY